MQYAEKCSQPYDFQICIIHLFLQGKLNNCSCSWSLLCISSLSCSALLPCWEPHREQTPLLWWLMEAWLWKFCLFGFFPLIFDSFSPFIPKKKWQHVQVQLVFPRKSHSPEHTMNFPFCVQGNAVTHWAWSSPTPEGGKSAGFSKEKTRTVNSQSPPSSLTCAAQVKGHRGSKESPNQNYSWGFPLCPTSQSLHAGQYLQVNLPQDCLEFGPWEWKAISLN